MAPRAAVARPGGICPRLSRPQGKVVIAQGVDPTTLDPMNHQESPAGNVCPNIFDTLLERDLDLKMQPALAREMPKLVAPTVWEFKLRPGVKLKAMIWASSSSRGEARKSGVRGRFPGPAVEQSIYNNP